MRLYEIAHDDSVYSKDASAHVANIELDGSWQPLQVKAPFWKPGYTISWKKAPYGFRVAVAYNGKIVIYMELDNYGAKVPGGNLIGLDVDSVSSRPDVRGTGLALRTYEALVESSQVLFSSNAQTSGSRALWAKLVTSPCCEPFVVAENAAARWYVHRHDPDRMQFGNKVLLTGSIEVLAEEAYACDETRWVVVPKDLPGLDQLREGAVNLPG